MSTLDDCIDPRFNFSFNNSKDTSKKCDAQLSTNKRFKKDENVSHSSDAGFSNYLAKQLAEILEKQVKHIDCSNSCPEDVHKTNSKGIQLFSNSDLLVTDVNKEEELIPCKKKKPKKKKKKESKETREDQFEEAAVTSDWIFRQSSIYNK